MLHREAPDQSGQQALTRWMTWTNGEAPCEPHCRVLARETAGLLTWRRGGPVALRHVDGLSGSFGGKR